MLGSAKLTITLTCPVVGPEYAVHSTRYAVHSTGCVVYDTRYTVHGTQCMVHSILHYAACRLVLQCVVAVGRTHYVTNLCAASESQMDDSNLCLESLLYVNLYARVG